MADKVRLQSTIGHKYILRCISDNDTGSYKKYGKKFYNQETESELVNYVDEIFTPTRCLPSMESLLEHFEVDDIIFNENIEIYSLKMRQRFCSVRTLKALATIQMQAEEHQYDDLEKSLRILLQTVISIQDEVQLVDFSDIFEDVIQEFKDRRFQVGLSGIDTGYEFMNAVTDGWQKGDLICFVGRPNLGKSWLWCQLLLTAWNNRHSVLAFSLEMSRTQLARRITALDLGLDPGSIKKASLSSWGERKLLNYRNELLQKPNLTFLEDSAVKTLANIEGAIKNMSPDIVFIDSIYLATPTQHTYTSNKVKTIFEEIKTIAHSNQVPIVLTTQFNRTVQKQEKSIDLNQIGESDTIGQICSFVVGIQEGLGENEHDERRLTIMKNREGGKDIVKRIHFKFNPLTFEEIFEDNTNSGYNTDFLAR